MICNKCNHPLPNDSEFCQYCGCRLETNTDTSTETEACVIQETDQNIPDVNLSDADNAINTVLKIQAQQTIKAMEENSKGQPNNEKDADFGLVPNKPVFTHALMSVDGETEYLNSLRTTNGEEIKWNRRGSMSVEGINGMIDIYDTYLPSGQPYRTIFINMYGAAKSNRAPDGFIFAKLKVTATKPTPSPKQNLPKSSATTSPNVVLVSCTNILAITITFISMLSIIMAMNLQDASRDTWENWSPTAVYMVLLLLLGGFLAFGIVSLIRKRFKLISLLSLVPFISAIVVLTEGSIFSSGNYRDSYYSNYYSSYYNYINDDIVYALNQVFLICVISIFIITLIPVIVYFIKKMRYNWHQSISYREKCYKRVAKIHGYLDRGIISQSEYEKTKAEILKHIE